MRSTCPLFITREIGREGRIHSTVATKLSSSLASQVKSTHLSSTHSSTKVHNYHIYIRRSVVEKGRPGVPSPPRGCISRLNEHQSWTQLPVRTSYTKDQKSWRTIKPLPYGTLMRDRHSTGNKNCSDACGRDGSNFGLHEDDINNCSCILGTVPNSWTNPCKSMLSQDGGRSLINTLKIRIF
jgi:hypothetical protein